MAVRWIFLRDLRGHKWDCLAFVLYSFVYLSLISLCVVGNFLSTHPVNESGCPLSWFTIDLFVYISWFSLISLFSVAVIMLENVWKREKWLVYWSPSSLNTGCSVSSPNSIKLWVVLVCWTLHHPAFFVVFCLFLCLFVCFFSIWLINWGFVHSFH